MTDQEIMKAINTVSKKAFDLNQTTDIVVHQRVDDVQSNTDEMVCDLLVDMACAQQGVESPNYSTTTLELTEDGDSNQPQPIQPVSYKFRVARTMVFNFINGTSVRSREEVEDRLAILQQSNFITEDEMFALLELLDSVDKKDEPMEESSNNQSSVDTQEPPQQTPVVD